MSDTDILARTIFGEARGLGKPGMGAVASTILNRVAKKTWYGLTITEVCKKPWQYSCWNATDPNCAIIEKADESIPVFLDAMNVATAAIMGLLVDTTNGATHYYSTTIPEPIWAQGHTPCASIVNMLFFNDIT